MYKNIKISIITVNYNDASGLEKTINSVQNQTCQDFEHIVIDGNSTDGSKDIIEKYKNSFSYWVSEPDKGIYHAMNKGIRKAKGEYLYFLNSGDIFYSTTVLKSFIKLIGEKKDIYYGNLVFDNGKGETVKKVLPKSLSFDFFYNGTIPHQAAIIKKTLFDSVFYYNEELKIMSDWEFFICAICKYNATYKYINLFISNHDKNGISSDLNNRPIMKRESKLTLKKHFPNLIEDYEQFQILKSNRFKMLLELESFKVTKKINAVWLRVLLFLFKKKRVKDL